MLKNSYHSVLRKALLTQVRQFAGPAGKTSYLKKSEVPVERFMNRSEWMGNKFKNESIGAYDWIPEIMTKIDPAP
jgi:hypothetical protein